MSTSLAILPARAGIVLVLGSVAATVVVKARTAPATTPSVVIDSQEGAKDFGELFAADGTALAAFDWSCSRRRCLQLVRIFEAANEVYQRHVMTWVQSFALRGDMLVLRTSIFDGERSDWSHKLELVVRVNGAWMDQPAIELDDACRGRDYYRQIALGANLLVLEAEERLCLFERTGTTWRYTDALHAKQPLALAVGGERIVTIHDDRVEVHERVADGTTWSRRFIVTPRRAVLGGVAASAHWVVVQATLAGDVTPVLLVYDAATGDHVDTLSSQFYDYVFSTGGFAVTDTTIAALGRVDQAWRYTGGAWHPRGALTRASKAPATDFRRGLAIGDLIWIGQPIYGRAPHGGQIEGFDVHFSERY
jgi:hypothetical protein